MQIKIFTIPIGDAGAAQEELNRFLRSHKILEIESQFVSHPHAVYWCFCVRYVEPSKPASPAKAKVDYKKVLDESTFEKFSKLRVIRKQVSAEEGVPAYAIFTDEELAQLAKLDPITEADMRAIKGIGDKKIERYAHHFIQPKASNET